MKPIHIWTGIMITLLLSTGSAAAVEEINPATAEVPELQMPSLGAPRAETREKPRIRLSPDPGERTIAPIEAEFIDIFLREPGQLSASLPQDNRAESRPFSLNITGDISFIFEDFRFYASRQDLLKIPVIAVDPPANAYRQLRPGDPPVDFARTPLGFLRTRQKK